MSQAATQKNLVLILARDLSSRLATSVALMDADGTVIYYNEAAATLFGRPFVEGTEITAEQWREEMPAVDEEGEPIPFSERAVGVVLTRHEPAHRELHVRGVDGFVRPIEATAIPLFAHAGEFIGGMVLFWERPEDA